MAEYIERESLRQKKEYSEEKGEYVVTLSEVERQPAACVTRVVRCKHCKNRSEKGICQMFRQRYPFYPRDDFYCGYGENKGD